MCPEGEDIRAVDAAAVLGDQRRGLGVDDPTVIGHQAHVAVEIPVQGGGSARAFTALDVGIVQVGIIETPGELDRAEVLDRSSKLAGVLRAMGVVPESGARLTFAEDVPPLARALGVLAAARIGLVVDLRAGAASDSASDLVVLHAIEDAPIEPGRASVRVTRSHFEGVGVTIGAETANLDQAMRDSRVEFAAVVPLDPQRTLVLTDDGDIEAASSLDWYRTEVLSAS